MAPLSIKHKKKAYALSSYDLEVHFAKSKQNQHEPSDRMFVPGHRQSCPVRAGTPSLNDPPIDFPNANATRAMSINPRGDIVGSYTIGSATHGYLLSDGNFTSIDYPGSVFTEIWGINARGDMIGRYRIAGDGSSRTRGFLLSRDGSFTDISVGNHKYTLPTGISPSGDVVGCFHDTNFLVDMRGYVQR